MYAMTDEWRAQINIPKRTYWWRIIVISVKLVEKMYQPDSTNVKNQSEMESVKCKVGKVYYNDAAKPLLQFN